MKTLFRSSLAAILGSIILSVPLITSAAPKNLVELANLLANIFNGGATFLVLLGVIIFFSGVLISVFNKGQGKINGEKFGQMILWGIVVIFVMVSIWGIIRLLQETLFGRSSSGAGAAGSGSAPLQFPNSSVL
ncbi:hypothetical protein HZC00_00910 [Candidatus Kaiserbacteria bacterium]|nr:hypothetical protein [Candidatus Kaiserbacteria bacterium]